MPAFFDTHAHLDYPDFAPDIGQVIDRAQAAGIVKIISIGTDLASSARALKLAEAHAEIYAVVGWHPSHALDAPTDIRPALRALARHPKVVALGDMSEMMRSQHPWVRSYFHGRRAQELQRRMHAQAG